MNPNAKSFFYKPLSISKPTQFCARYDDLENLPMKLELLKGAFALGLVKLTPMQKQILPALLTDPAPNMVLQSGCGSGKTVAYMLNMLQRVDITRQYPQALWLCPTYELAVQTARIAAVLAQFYPELQLRTIVDDTYCQRSLELSDHVLIGTPQWVRECGCSCAAFDFHNIDIVVLDEVDALLKTPVMHDSCFAIYHKLQQPCQMLLCSATFQNTFMDYANFLAPNAFCFAAAPDDHLPAHIQQFYVECASDDYKLRVIERIYQSLCISQSVIYCNAAEDAEWLYEKLHALKFSLELLLGEFSDKKRLDVLDKFRQGDARTLIVGELLPRGLDVPQISLVINFDVPVDQAGQVDFETYVHRLGRAGRDRRSSIAINLVENQHGIGACYQIIEHFKTPVRKLDLKL